MLSILKDKYIISYLKTSNGLRITLEKGETKHYFGLKEPGNVFIYGNSKWHLLDTASIKSDRSYKNYMDKASHDLTYVLTKYPIE